MYDLSPLEWALSVFAAISIGMAKAGFGGLGMLAILIMARVLPPRESTGAILPMLILADIFAVHTYRAHAKGILVLKMIPPALVGIICGWLLMPHIPTQAFGRFIGWLTLALVLLVLVQKFAPRWTNFAVEHPGIAWPFGWLAGSTTMLANAAGPVMTVYLLACRLPKFEFVGTAAWFFFVINLSQGAFQRFTGAYQRREPCSEPSAGARRGCGDICRPLAARQNQPGRFRMADDHFFAVGSAAPGLRLNFPTAPDL